MDDIQRNYLNICENIENACISCGRDASEVEVMAVTKTVEPQRIDRAYEVGIRNFGENRVQEWLKKEKLVNSQIKWDMIGQLQKNKVKYLLNTISMIQSLDRESLAGEIDKQAKKLGVIVDVLVQVNIGSEHTKAGVEPKDAIGFIEKVCDKYDSIFIKGLMAIAPAIEPEKTRPYFSNMYNLFEKAKEVDSDRIDIKVLSMGMTGDYLQAIKEGATLVRLGSAIFGGRKP